MLGVHRCRTPHRDLKSRDPIFPPENTPGQRISRDLKSLVVWRSEKKTLQQTHSIPSFLEGPVILKEV